MNRKKLYIFFSLLSFMGYAWLGWNVVEQSAHSSVPVVCLFKEVTGIPCPSCGTTRSLIELMRGNVKEAFLINPFGLVMAFAILAIPLWIAADTVRRSDSFYRSYGMMEQVLASNKWVSISAVMIVLLNWFWNITKGL